jgi:hypothetical protein
MMGAPVREVVDTQLHFGTQMPFRVGAFFSAAGAAIAMTAAAGRGTSGPAGTALALAPFKSIRSDPYQIP